MTHIQNRFLQIQATRKHELQQSLQQELEVYHYPRLVMFGLIVLTALSAFVLSFGLRMAGVTDLALRYLIVWVLVYLLFIGLARVWAGWQLSKKDYGFDADVGELMPDGSISTTADYSGGGGAKGSWGDTANYSATMPDNSGAQSFVSSPYSKHIDTPAATGSDSWLDDFDIDVGEAGLPIVVVLAILAFIASMIGGLAWVSYSLVETAPILLAELLADVMIVNGLGRRLSLMPVENEHWFFSLWQRTQKFFWLIVALIVCLFLILHLGHIHVQTLGEIFQFFKQNRLIIG